MSFSITKTGVVPTIRYEGRCKNCRCEFVCDPADVSRSQRDEYDCDPSDCVRCPTDGCGHTVHVTKRTLKGTPR